MKRWICCLFASLLLSAAQAAAEIDQDRMKRDLTIMESVLARFFEIDNEDVNGFYLPEKGVVLMTRDAAPDVNDIIVTSSGDHDAPAKIHQIKVKVNKQQEEKTDRLKQKVAEFLSTYADAIGQLKEDERVTVLVLPGKDFDRSFPILGMKSPERTRYRTTGELADSNEADTVRVEKKVYRTPSRSRNIEIEEFIGPELKNHERFMQKFEQSRDRDFRIRVSHPGSSEYSALEAGVAKRDIDAVSRGKIDQKAFMDRITFRENQVDSALAKKIDVMAEIIDAALGQNGNDYGLFGRTKSTGIYLQSLGAVFFTSHRIDRFLWVAKDAAHVQAEDPVQKLKTELITTVADYGATLRGLEPDEWIVVNLDLGNRGKQSFVQFLHEREDGETDVTMHKKMPQRILLRVQKKHAEAYAIGKMDLKAFKEKVLITEM